VSMRSDRATLGPRGRCWQEGARAGVGAARCVLALCGDCAAAVWFAERGGRARWYCYDGVHQASRFALVPPYATVGCVREIEVRQPLAARVFVVLFAGGFVLYIGIDFIVAAARGQDVSGAPAGIVMVVFAVALSYRLATLWMGGQSHIAGWGCLGW